MRFRLHALLLLVLLTSATALAEAPPPLPARYSPEVTADHVVKVPMVIDENARLVASNTDRIGELGIARTDNGLESKRYAKKLQHVFAFRPATPEEIAAGKATHTGYATRYKDKVGSVNGDGRVVTLEQVLVREDRSGKFQGVYDIQVKGVHTGLIPNGADGTNKKGLKEGHTLGYANTNELGDAVLSEYLRHNGVRRADFLAYFDTGKEYEGYFHGNGGTEIEYGARSGLYVRGGDFFRLGHLLHFKDDPKALRELIDFQNEQLSREMGRKAPLRLDEYLRAMVRRVTEHWADLYWLRVVDGSLTYDNFFLNGHGDFGTMSTVDRAHQGFRYVERVSPGFGKETDWIVHQYLPELARHVLRATSIKNPLERSRVARASQEIAALAARELDHAMGERMLGHLGLDGDEARLLMKTNKREVLALLRTLREVGEAPAPGVVHKMGYAQNQIGKCDGCTGVDPARYDLFHAAGALFEIAASSASSDDKRAALATALQALDPDALRDHAAAGRLLEAAAPVVEAVLARYPVELRSTKARLVGAQGKAINAPVDLTRANFWGWGGHIRDRLANAPHEVPGKMAEMRSWMRQGARKGPGSPADVARRLRREHVEYADKDRVRLSRSAEGGVAIEELSDGANDALRISLAGDPLRLGDHLRYGMRYRIKGGGLLPDQDAGSGWLELEPRQKRAGQAVFEVRLDGPPASVEVKFFDRQDPGREWDNHGKNFGAGLQLVLSSPLVDAALAGYADARGRVRARTDLEAIALAVYERALHAPDVRVRRAPGKLDQRAGGNRALELLRRRVLTQQLLRQPAGAPQKTPDGKWQQDFHVPHPEWGGGRLVANPKNNGAYLVRYGFQHAYASGQHDTGPPLEDERWTGSGTEQKFEKGSLFWTQQRGVWFEPKDNLVKVPRYPPVATTRMGLKARGR